MLAIFLINILIDGLGRIDWAFIKNLPSRKAENAGIYTALMGTVWILVLTAIIAIPIGVAAGIYLEEYGKNRDLLIFWKLILPTSQEFLLLFMVFWGWKYLCELPD